MEQIWDNLPAVAGFAVPFLVVLGLVGLATLLWRRFRTATASLTSGRRKQSRLAVIDTAIVDARRRLLLVRRDNAEHLIMIGGPTDIVIEPNIGQLKAFSPARDAPAAASPADPAFEAWSGPRTDPMQAAGELLVIPQRELRQEAGQGYDQGGNEGPIAPPHPRNPPAPERPVAASALSALPSSQPDPAQDTDASLAELAHRLEAALRRPTRPAEQ
jgi:flagellar protein FliO/FliZ